MENFSYCSPTQFVFGRDVEAQVGEVLAQRGAKKVLIHYGKNSVVKSGLLARIVASLEAAHIAHVELGGVRPNPEISLVREAIALAREQEVDWILAVGGGSVIDSAKAVAAGVHYAGDAWEIFEKKPALSAVLPMACVLTIPAAGSEGSKNTVVSNDELGLKSGYPNDLLRARVAFMNPELTYTLPPYQSAAGATDMFAHLLERFFSESGNVAVTDNMIISLMRTIRACAPRILEDPHDYEARANIMWAGMLAHCGIAGCGRIEDWATHGLEHELSALKPQITHGAGLAVMYPAWMRYVYKENPARFALYGREVFGLASTDSETADARRAIEATEQFFTSLGMPHTLAELEIYAEDIERMLPTLIQNKGEVFGSFKKLSREDARKIYELAL
ncbi:MAG: iron-containing alcohol dehydrogenase [Raoultibacter sp.]